jgi:hypothetical protein
VPVKSPSWHRKLRHPKTCNRQFVSGAAGGPVVRLVAGRNEVATDAVRRMGGLRAQEFGHALAIGHLRWRDALPGGRETRRRGHQGATGTQAKGETLTGGCPGAKLTPFQRGRRKARRSRRLKGSADCPAPPRPGPPAPPSAFARCGQAVSCALGGCGPTAELLRCGLPLKCQTFFGTIAFRRLFGMIPLMGGVCAGTELDGD